MTRRRHGSPPPGRRRLVHLVPTGVVGVADLGEGARRRPRLPLRPPRPPTAAHAHVPVVAEAVGLAVDVGAARPNQRRRQSPVPDPTSVRPHTSSRLPLCGPRALSRSGAVFRKEATGRGGVDRRGDGGRGSIGQGKDRGSPRSEPRKEGRLPPPTSRPRLPSPGCLPDPGLRNRPTRPAADTETPSPKPQVSSAALRTGKTREDADPGPATRTCPQVSLCGRYGSLGRGADEATRGPTPREPTSRTLDPTGQRKKKN